ncbi:metallophosphoesterase family protein [Haloparvum sp. AD34]
MQVGVISDVHGNRVAFDAVLDDMPSVDEVIHAGDAVGYNPWPGECVDRIRSASIPSVQGNHDRAVADGDAFRFNSLAGAGVKHAKSTLDDERIEWLGSLPAERFVADGRVRIVHGHPMDPDRYTYPEEFRPDLITRGLDAEESAEAERDPDVLVMGHTHVQGHAVYDEGIVLNPGSVGQPRDGDPRAAYAVVDLDAMTVDERRVEYDVDRVVEAVENADLPRRIGTRLREGK